MRLPDSNVPEQQSGATAKHSLAKLALPRVFIFLLLTATILSVISMLSFVAYVIFHSAAHTQYAILYTMGIAGLAVAEVCQIAGIVVLIVQWLSKQNTEKKPREIAVLLLSLIPYMVILVFLVTLIVYFNLRRQASSPERQREARQELKEQVVDTIIDYGANLSSSSATPAQIVTPAHQLAAPAMKDAIRQVIGPTAAKSVSGVSNGLLVSTVFVLIASTVALGSVAIPQILRGGSAATSNLPPKPGTVGYVSLGGVQPDDIVASSNGDLWLLALDGKNQYEAEIVTPAGSVKTYPLPISGPKPGPYSYNNIFHDVAVGSDGNLWFTDAVTEGQAPVTQEAIGFIGRVTPAGAFHKFSLPRYQGQTFEAGALAVGSDGNLWFTVRNTSGAAASYPFGRISSTGTFTFVPTHTYFYPNVITSGPDGGLWFADQSTLGRVTSGGSVQEFTSESGFALLSLAAGLDGNLWFTWHYEGADGCMVGSITPKGSFNLPTTNDSGACNANSGITVASGRTLFCGDSQIGMYTSTGAHLDPASPLLCGGSITLAKNGTVWFTQRGKVAVIMP